MRFIFLLLPLMLMACQSVTGKFQSDDRFLWLERIEGEKALKFAKEENERTLNHFRQNPLFQKIDQEAREILYADDRLPSVTLYDGELYNFWQDKDHVRGIWRKTSIDSYQKKNPQWETILDIDALAEAENENWVLKFFYTYPFEPKRALVGLSRGGKDAVVVREFDIKSKSFVKDGFYIPEAKTYVTWRDADSLFVATDFGPGTMTLSGYARSVRVWQRGTPLSDADQILKAPAKNMNVGAWTSFRPEENYKFLYRRISFYESEEWYVTPEQQIKQIPMPLDSDFVGAFKGYALYVLRSPIDDIPTGSLVGFPLSKINEGSFALKHLEVIFKPSAKKFFLRVDTTKDYLLLNVIDDIKAGVERVAHLGPRQWRAEKIPLGASGSASITSTDRFSNTYIASYSDYLTPPSLYIGDARNKKPPRRLKSLPQRFDAKDMLVERREAVSKDGTKIPYSLVYRKGLQFDGKNPTLLYGYGGFEIPLLPSYNSPVGKSWIERGGVYVVANLRGGGEFGPEWHKSVLKENRPKVYDDFNAVAESLIQSKVTSPQHLGVQGRSNGGLLTGVAFTSRPDLYGAAISGVPLLDMIRYHKLLAGASWMAEYGDPEDAKMREVILSYSPYQNLKKDVRYPEVLIMTSTKDDRVHPGHARKMVAKMKEQGHPVYYYENLEGGHAGTTNIEQRVLWHTLEMTYLWEKLK